MSKNKYLFAFILVLFIFLWAFLHNLNPILIPHLKKACQLSDTQSALIDFSIYLGYFVIAIPAGLFMHRFGYKKGILFGLFLFAAGALLFIPAASDRNYLLFPRAYLSLPAALRSWRPWLTPISLSWATGRLRTAPEFRAVL